MAGPKRNPLDFGFGERSFVQRFILAEILGPPKARSPVAPPRPAVDDPAQDATRPAGGEPGPSSSG
ncbi:MAG TPA: hypothetical protein VHT91_31550 [Kofleriaceae bacterium]|jgi:hypothetical protein|nr:hypothetical protein [Kofleriaceae bacterium]